MVKLKNLIEEKVDVPDNIAKMGYTILYKMKLERWPIYGRNVGNASLVVTEKTVAVQEFDKQLAYIVELKKFGRIAWKGKEPASISTGSSRYNIVGYTKV